MDEYAPKEVEKRRKMIPFPNKKYQIIYADPPWEYQMRQHGGVGDPETGGAVSHYPVMSMLELEALPIDQIADKDCLLFMWTTGPQLDRSIEVGKAWGFVYKTVAFIWNKLRVNPGHYTMSQCEMVLVFKRGRIPQPRGARNVRQIVSEKRTRHSAKPSEVRNRIEQMFPEQAKIELFAREKVGGWDAWGDEI